MNEDAQRIAAVVGAAGAVLAFLNSSKRDTLPGNVVRLIQALVIGALMGACVYVFLGGWSPP